MKINCSIGFGATPLDQQEYQLEITADSFADELAPARTFCIYQELEQLIAMGLVKGGSLDNAIVIHNGAIICKDELRYSDELVRHKIIDIIGDIFLVGQRVKAEITAVKPGHPTNVQLAREMLNQKVNQADCSCQPCEKV